MAIVKTDDKHYKAIANRIRDISMMEDATFTPEQMANEGMDLVYGMGSSDGYTQGFNDAYTEIREINSQLLTDINTSLENKGAETAETLQDVPQRIDSIEAGGGDIPDGFIKVDPTWTNFSQLCMERPSMVHHIKYSDTANGKLFLSMCQQVKTPIIPSWDLRNATTIQNMFIYSTDIVEIGEMNIPKVTITDNAFLSCISLERISFAPNCIHVNINFFSCSKLTDTSVQSIIDGLADLTGQTAQTLTLHTTVGAKLTDAQKASAAAKNWTLAY